MKHGLNLPNGGLCGDARSLAELAHIAEEAGWDGVFLEDYIVYHSGENPPTFDPWISLAAMALRTERIRLGTLITPLIRRRPWKVARETVTLDHLSNGRLVLGVGLGDANDPGFARVGDTTGDKQSAGKLDEALEVLVGLWSGEPFSFSGEYYHVEDVTLLPKPLQKPRIPIWVGGGWPLSGPTQRAALWDGSCMYKHTYGGPWEDWSPENVRSLKTFVDGQRDGDNSFDIVIGGRRRADDWEVERALIRSLAEAGATWWIEWAPPEEFEQMKNCVAQGPIRID
jgi:alkanesulfonate monooxygenase SsuD/methylene tetrahydromethanopterin reductase-like flavin-dependent oxidoreductase (luciferase family)